MHPSHIAAGKPETQSKHVTNKVRTMIVTVACKAERADITDMEAYVLVQRGERQHWFHVILKAWSETYSALKPGDLRKKCLRC